LEPIKNVPPGIQTIPLQGGELGGATREASVLGPDINGSFQVKPLLARQQVDRVQHRRPGRVPAPVSQA